MIDVDEPAQVASERSTADRAATLARCIAIVERRGRPTRALLRVLASLRPEQPVPTDAERAPTAGKRRAFVPGNGQRLMPLRPKSKAPARIDTAKVRR